MKFKLQLIMHKKNSMTNTAAKAVIQGISTASLEEADQKYVFYTDNPDDMGIVFVRVIGSLELRAYLYRAYTTFPDEGTIECTNNIMFEP